ncbi:MAG: methyltransferase domain-containing protein [Sphingobacteriales bacterium]|nr:MAG: methyltransferase domain-containing protein [Sphingobacteriales bacterium]
MQEMPLVEQAVVVEAASLTLLLPDAVWMQAHFRSTVEAGRAPVAPYWSRIWPSSYALAAWLHKHPELVSEKQVLELAAGIGLPSLSIAPLAREVLASDYLPEAVALLQRNAEHLGRTNFQARLLDWNELPEDLTTDVLLLSDVNYDPSDFAKLLAVLTRFLHQGVTVILATPQRIMGAAFIAALDGWIREASEERAGDVPISIYRLAAT